MDIKSGDVVKINGVTYWICDCADAPLNYMKREDCILCGQARPEQPAQEDVAKLAPYCEKCTAFHFKDEVCG